MPIDDLLAEYNQPEDYRPLVDTIGEKYPSVSKDIVKSLIQRESSGRTFATVDTQTKHGEARGLGQFIDSTAKDFIPDWQGPEDSYVPEKNIEGIFRYLDHLQKKTGSTERALQLYLGGGESDRFGTRPTDYAKQILSNAGKKHDYLEPESVPPKDDFSAIDNLLDQYSDIQPTEPNITETEQEEKVPVVPYDPDKYYTTEKPSDIFQKPDYQKEIMESGAQVPYKPEPPTPKTHWYTPVLAAMASIPRVPIGFMDWIKSDLQIAKERMESSGEIDRPVTFLDAYSSLKQNNPKEYYNKISSFAEKEKIPEEQRQKYIKDIDEKIGVLASAIDKMESQVPEEVKAEIQKAQSGELNPFKNPSEALNTWATSIADQTGLWLSNIAGPGAGAATAVSSVRKEFVDNAKQHGFTTNEITKFADDVAFQAGALEFAGEAAMGVAKVPGLNKVSEPLKNFIGQKVIGRVAKALGSAAAEGLTEYSQQAVFNHYLGKMAKEKGWTEEQIKEKFKNDSILKSRDFIIGAGIGGGMASVREIADYATTPKEQKNKQQEPPPELYEYTPEEIAVRQTMQAQPEKVEPKPTIPTEIEGTPLRESGEQTVIETEQKTVIEPEESAPILSPQEQKEIETGVRKKTQKTQVIPEVIEDELPSITDEDLKRAKPDTEKQIEEKVDKKTTESKPEDIEKIENSEEAKPELKQKLNYDANIVENYEIKAGIFQPVFTDEYNKLSDEEKFKRLKEEKKAIDKQIAENKRSGQPSGTILTIRKRLTKEQNKYSTAKTDKRRRESGQLKRYTDTGETKTAQQKYVDGGVRQFVGITDIQEDPAILNQYLKRKYTKSELKSAINAISKGKQGNQAAKDIRREIGEYIQVGTKPTSVIDIVKRQPEYGEDKMFFAKVMGEKPKVLTTAKESTQKLVNYFFQTPRQDRKGLQKKLDDYFGISQERLEELDNDAEFKNDTEEQLYGLANQYQADLEYAINTGDENEAKNIINRIKKEHQRKPKSEGRKISETKREDVSTTKGKTTEVRPQELEASAKKSIEISEEPITFTKSIREVEKQIPKELWNTVVISVKKTPDGTQGQIYRSGDKLHVDLNPDMPVNRIVPVLFHDVMGHAGATNVVKTNKKVYKRLKAMYNSPSAKMSKTSIQKAYKQELENAKKSGRDPEEVLFSEWIAHNVERHLANPKKRGTGYKVYRAIREFLIGLGITEDTVEDVIERVVEEIRRTNKFEPTIDTEVRFAKETDPFYSPTERTISEIKQEKNVVPQIKSMINKGKFKKAEIEWMGLEQWLDENPKATKQDILDFVRSNEVKVEETEKDVSYKPVLDWYTEDGETRGYEDTGLYSGDFIITKLDSGSYKLEHPNGENLGTYSEIDDAKIAAQDIVNEDNVTASGTGDPQETKYSQYTLPNGKNYRELLFKTPISSNTEFDKFESDMKEKYGDNYISAMSDKEMEKYEALESNKFGGVFAKKPDVYQSSHWDEPNIFAHARVNDRTTPEGEKVLFIEEIQSDWDRDARDKGIQEKYRRDELSIVPKEDAEVFDEFVQKNMWLVEALGQVYQLPKNKYKTAEDAIDYVLKEKKKTPGVSDFPHRKNWQEYVLKNLLGKAVQEGYDRVAWISGEQTADRYDLSKQADRVTWNPDNKMLRVFKGSNVVFSQTLKNESEIADYIGKDPAKKLLEQEVKESDTAPPVQELDGENLKIGGEWAVSLYDNQIPSFLKKYTKKWNAKIEPVKIGKNEQMSIEITPEMRESITEQGQPLFAKELPAEQKVDRDNQIEYVKNIEKTKRSLKAKLRYVSDELLSERAQIGLMVKQIEADVADIVRNKIYDYARKIGLNGERYNRVDTLIKNSKTARNYEKAVEIMDEVLEKRQKHVLRRKLKTMVMKEKKRLKGLEGKKRSKQDYDANVRLKDYIEGLSDVPQNKLERLQKTVDYFQKNPEEEMPESVKKEVVSLLKTNIRDMDSKQLAKAIQDINQIKKYGKLKFELKEAQRKRAIEASAKVASKQIKETTKEEPKTALEKAVERGFVNKKLQSLENLGKKYGWSHIRPERIIEWFTGFKESPLYKNVFERALKAETDQLVNMEKTFKFFDDINKDVNMAMVMNKPFMTLEINSGGKNLKEKISLDQMMFIYANSQNPSNRAHLQGTGIDDGLIEIVTENLPKKYKNIVDDVINYYDTVQYKRINEVFSKEHGIDMPQEHRYFPIMNLKTDRAETEVMNDLIARYSSRIGSVQKGMTKSRVQSKAPYKSLSFYETVVKNLKDTEHYIAYNDAIREINQFLNNKQIREAMEEKSEEATNQIKDWVKAIAYGKNRSQGTAVDKVSDWLRTNYMTAVLGFNLVTMMKQTASFAQGLAQVNKPKAVLSSAEFISNPKKMNDFVDSKSPMMKNRGTSFERELAEIAERDSVKNQLGTKNVLGKTKDIAMKGITVADKATTTILWYTKYNDVMNKTGNENVAIDQADKLIRKTQPMGGIVHLPSIYRGGGLARAYTMFTNQLNQNLNLMFELQQTWGQKPTKYKIVETAFYTIVPATLIYMASHGGRLPTEDPEGFARSFVQNLTGGFMLLNKLIDAGVLFAGGAIKKARGGRADTRRKLDYALNFAPTSFGALEDLGSGIGYGSPERLLDAIAKLTGTPYLPVKRAWRGIKKTIEKKDPRYLIWSESALKNKSIKQDVIDMVDKNSQSIDEKKKIYEYVKRNPEIKEKINDENYRKIKNYIDSNKYLAYISNKKLDIYKSYKKSEITEKEYEKQIKTIEQDQMDYNKWKENMRFK